MVAPSILISSTPIWHRADTGIIPLHFVQCAIFYLPKNRIGDTLRINETKSVSP